MKLTQSLDESKKNHMRWWRGEDIGRPLIHLYGRGGAPVPRRAVLSPEDYRMQRLDAELVYGALKKSYSERTLFGDTLPHASMGVGVGDMAAYLGCKPFFAPDTTWLDPIVEEGAALSSLGPLVYNDNNYWWTELRTQYKKLVGLSANDGFIFGMNDILENFDILALLCGSQNMCYYLMDEPELVKKYIDNIDDLYFEYYDRLYDIIKSPGGGSGCIFNIWSEKRTLKIQCDVAVLMSVDHFRQLAIPSFEKQLERIDYSLYHLDGPDAIKYLDAVLGLKRLSALQFTPGDGNPDAANERWYPIYDKVRKAGKSLWINMSGDDPLEDSRRLVNRYGTAGLYLLYQDQDMETAGKIMDAASGGFK